MERHQPSLMSMIIYLAGAVALFTPIAVLALADIRQSTSADIYRHHSK